MSYNNNQITFSAVSEPTRDQKFLLNRKNIRSAVNNYFSN